VAESGQRSGRAATPDLRGQLQSTLGADCPFACVAKRALYFPGFRDEQRGHHLERETASEFPARDDPSARPLHTIVEQPRQLPEKSGSRRRIESNRSEQNLSEQNLSEQKIVAGEPPTEPTSNWVADGVELWQQKVGHVEHGMFGKLLKPSVQRHGWEVVLGALNEYLQHPGVKRIDWFAKEVVKWIEEAKVPWFDNETRLPTAKWHRIYGGSR
jgi:hypothetical protein